MSACLHGRSADGTVGLFLLEPLPASGTFVVPFDDLLYPLHADGLEAEAHDPCDVLNGIVVRPYGPVDVHSKCQHRHVNRGEPADVPCPLRSLLDLPQGFPGTFGYVHHVPPQGEARILVLLQFPNDAWRAYVVLLREGIHREECGAVQYEHACRISSPN